MLNIIWSFINVILFFSWTIFTRYQSVQHVFKSSKEVTKKQRRKITLMCIYTFVRFGRFMERFRASPPGNNVPNNNCYTSWPAIYDLVDTPVKMVISLTYIPSKHSVISLSSKMIWLINTLNCQQSSLDVLKWSNLG